jgi:SAM-dependent methyltransferase
LEEKLGILSKYNILADKKNKERLLDFFDENSSASFLEIGAGACHETSAVAQVIGTAAVTVLEFPGAGEQALAKGFNLIEHDVTQLPWSIDEDVFDVVLANQVLEHIPNTDEFLEEIHRVLAPGGYLVVSIPNLGSWINIVLLLFTIQPPHCWVSDKWTGVGNPLSSMRHKRRPFPPHSHLRLFTPRGMRELLELHGFCVEAVSAGSYGLPSIVDQLAVAVDKYHGIYTTSRLGLCSEMKIQCSQVEKSYIQSRRLSCRLCIL